jgi:hypothetical protein
MDFTTALPQVRSTLPHEPIQLVDQQQALPELISYPFQCKINLSASALGHGFPLIMCVLISGNSVTMKIQLNLPFGVRETLIARTGLAYPAKQRLNRLSLIKRSQSIGASTV